MSIETNEHKIRASSRLAALCISLAANQCAGTATLGHFFRIGPIMLFAWWANPDADQTDSCRLEVVVSRPVICLANDRSGLIVVSVAKGKHQNDDRAG
jgi:hypothetical protein